MVNGGVVNLLDRSVAITTGVVAWTQGAPVTSGAQGFSDMMHTTCAHVGNYFMVKSS